MCSLWNYRRRHWKLIKGLYFQRIFRLICLYKIHSMDIYHGLSGHLPRIQWTVRTMSIDTWDKANWVYGQSLDNVHGCCGYYPWLQWTLSMDSLDSLNTVHGYPGHCPESPGGLDNVIGRSHSESMDWVDIVQYVLVKLENVFMKHYAPNSMLASKQGSPHNV